MYFQFYKVATAKKESGWLLSATITTDAFVLKNQIKTGISKADFILKNKLKGSSFKNNIVFQTFEANQGCIFRFDKERLVRIDYFQYAD